MKKSHVPRIIGRVNPDFRRASEREIQGMVRGRKPIRISRDEGKWARAAKKVFDIAGRSSARRVGAITLQRLRRRGRVSEVHLRSFVRKRGRVVEKPGSYRRLRRL